MYKLYNGAPNRALQNLWNHRAALKAEAEALGYHLTWYPAEECWGAGVAIGSDKPYRAVGPLCHSIEAAAAHVRADFATENLL